MAKRKKFKPARFMPGRGVPWHGGMAPLPQKCKKSAVSLAGADGGKVGQDIGGIASSISEKGGNGK